MEESNYKFQIGDIVRVQYNGFDDICIVCDRFPDGGGYRKQEPLYRVYYESGFPQIIGLTERGDDKRYATFHAMFLTIEQPYLPDVELDMSDLI